MPPTRSGGRFSFGLMLTVKEKDRIADDGRASPGKPGDLRCAIRVQSLSKTFERDGQPLQTLRDVNFYARDGEFVSIIGPSGCGKSTLLNIIAGLDGPTSGSLSLYDRQGTNRLGSVGYMQQKDLLLPWRSVLDNATLGLELQGVPRREAEDRARQHLGRFGLEGFENSYPHSLSGGMRQRPPSFAPSWQTRRSSCWTNRSALSTRSTGRAFTSGSPDSGSPCRRPS